MRVKVLYFLVVFGLVIGNEIFTEVVSAVNLSNRAISIKDSTISSTTTYDVSFDYSSVASVGSLVVEFCSNTPLFYITCTQPTGINVSASSLINQSGETGFSVDPSTTTNRLVLSRTPSLTSMVSAKYTLSGIVNPDYVGTVYARIATHASNDGSGPLIDSGGVAFSTARGVSVKSYVPPYLTFCVGVTVASDCTSASGNFLGFGELSSVQSKTLTSQYAGATNDPGGYSTFVYGITMSSGSNIIPALTIPTTSQTGTSQFGMNLRANSSPASGQNRSGGGSSQALSDFDQINRFTFKNTVVSSSSIPTDFNVFTVTYVVNVSASQPPGIYNTTLTYIATAAF